MTRAKRRGNYLFCPEYGMMTVDYEPYQRRFKCLSRACGWMDEEETDSGDYDCLTGSFYERRRHEKI